MKEAEQEEGSEVDVDVEDESFKAEMNRLRGVDVDDAPATNAGEEDADDEPKSEQEDVIQPETESAQQEETKEDLRQQVEKLQKALDRTNGTYGSQLANLQNQIRQLTEQGQQKSQNTDQAKEAEQQIEITEDDFEEMKGDFPDLAGMTAKGFNRALQKMYQKIAASGGNPGEAVTQQIADQNRRIDESITKLKLEALESVHPDYFEIAGIIDDKETGMSRWNNLEFGNWLATQPKETQDQVMSSDNPYILSGHITAFKKFLEDKKSLEEKPAAKKINIEKAIQPKGVPRSSSGVLDPEDHGFREEIKRLRGMR